LSRGGASGAGTERCKARREWEGKADKRAPLVSCPERKVKGRGAVRPAGWAGPWPVGRVGCAVRWEKEGEKLAWAVRVWAGGLCVCWVPAHGG
jgi:hypothetical protein